MENPVVLQLTYCIFRYIIRSALFSKNGAFSGKSYSQGRKNQFGKRSQEGFIGRKPFEVDFLSQNQEYIYIYLESILPMQANPQPDDRQSFSAVRKGGGENVPVSGSQLPSEGSLSNL